MTPTIFTAVIGLLTALPELVGLINSIWGYLDRTSSGNTLQFLKDLAQVFNQLNNAKTDQEKSDAAKAISDTIAKLNL